MLMLEEKYAITKRRDRAFNGITELEVERRRLLNDLGEYTSMMGQ
jgi:hypothetical protein